MVHGSRKQQTITAVHFLLLFCNYKYLQLKVEACDENRWHVILILFVDKFYFTCVVIVGYLPHTRKINIKIREKILKYIFLTSKNFLSLFDGIRTLLLLLLLFILFVSNSPFFLIISR